MNEDRTYPTRPIVGVGAVVWREDKVLLVKRGRPPAKGQWSLPGGTQELGEGVEETARREVREDTGCEIKDLGFLGAFDSIERDARGGIRYHFTLVDFNAAWASGEPSPGKAELEAHFFALDELDALDLWDPVVEVIRLGANARA